MNEDQSPPSNSAPGGSPGDLQTLAALAPVARQSVVDAVADRLRNEILTGRLRPGVRLPSERELSLALGVNRLTLRASLARLEALGLITTRHGAGSVVASWRERAGLEMLGTLVKGLKVLDPAWHELVRSALELRRILSVEAVALAAERHEPDDIDAIATCVQVLQEHLDDPVAFARADLALMRSVCKAARSIGLELFLNTFARWPDEHPQLVAILYDDTANSFTIYPPLVEVIKARNPEMARSLVRKALESLDAAWTRRHPPPGLPAPVLPGVDPVAIAPARPAVASAPASPAASAASPGRSKKEKKR